MIAGTPTYSSGVRLSAEGKARIEQLAGMLAPLGVPIHITSGDRTAAEQAAALLKYDPELKAYGATTRNAFKDKPRDLATWTAIVTALQARGAFDNDHMARPGEEHGRNADIRVRDLNDQQRQHLLEKAKLVFSYVGKITNHLHVGW